jgi:DNA-binding response OmpR family regulator
MLSTSILVADDHDSFALALKERLCAEGYQVHTCKDAYQALAIARKEHPDLLILDVHMPAGSGFSVLDRLKSVPEIANTPVIIVTGDYSMETMLEADRHGVDLVLQKPFSTHDLLAYVRAALNDTPELHAE